MTDASKTIENVEKVANHIAVFEFIPKRQAYEIADLAVSTMGYDGAMHPEFGYKSIMKAWGFE